MGDISSRLQSIMLSIVYGNDCKSNAFERYAGTIARCTRKSSRGSKSIWQSQL